jgi:hypothetical protein
MKRLTEAMGKLWGGEDEALSRGEDEEGAEGWEDVEVEGEGKQMRRKKGESTRSHDHLPGPTQHQHDVPEMSLDTPRRHNGHT